MERDEAAGEQIPLDIVNEEDISTAGKLNNFEYDMNDPLGRRKSKFQTGSNIVILIDISSQSISSLKK